MSFNIKRAIAMRTLTYIGCGFSRVFALRKARKDYEGWF